MRPVSSGRAQRTRASSASKARAPTTPHASKRSRQPGASAVRSVPRQVQARETRTIVLQRAASASRAQLRTAPRSSASSTTGLVQPEWVQAAPHRPLSPRRARERDRRQEEAIAAAQARQSSRSRVPASRAAASGARLHNIASERAAAHDAARRKQEFSFSPQITRKARLLDKQRSQSVDTSRQAADGRGGESRSRFHSLYNSAVEQRKRVAAKAKKLAQDPEATFKPQITAKARRLSRSASAEPSRGGGGTDVSQAAGQRLYTAALNQQRSLEAKRDAAARTPSSTFQPHLNRKSLSMVEGDSPRTPTKGGAGNAPRSAPGSKRKPLYDAGALKAAQERLEATRSKLELASCTFSPATNHNSKFTGRDARPVSRASSRSSSRSRGGDTDGDVAPAHERLLAAGARREAARQAKLAAKAEAESALPFKPTVDTKSRVLAERVRQRQEAALHAMAAQHPGATPRRAAKGDSSAGPSESKATSSSPRAQLSAQDQAAGERAAGFAAAGLPEEAVAATQGSEAAAHHAAAILGTGGANGSDSPRRMTAFDRLYSEQWLLQAKQAAAAEAAAADEVKALMHKPTISAHSAELASARANGGEGMQPVWQRLFAEQWRDRSAIEQAREAAEAAELAKCTFQPELHPDSFARTVDSSATEDDAPVWQRLYVDSFHAREVEQQRLEAAEQRARLLSTAAPRRLQAMREQFEAEHGTSVQSLADTSGSDSIFDALHTHAAARRDSIKRQEALNAKQARRLSTTISPSGQYKQLQLQSTEKAKLQARQARAQRRASFTHAVNASSLNSSRTSVASSSVRSSTASRAPPTARQLLVPAPTAVPLPAVPQSPDAGSVSSADSSFAGTAPAAEPRSVLARPAAAPVDGQAAEPPTTGGTVAAATGLLAAQAPADSTPLSPTGSAAADARPQAQHSKAAWAPTGSSAGNSPAPTREVSAASSPSHSPSTSRRSSSASSASSSAVGVASPPQPKPWTAPAAASGSPPRGRRSPAGPSGSGSSTPHSAKAPSPLAQGSGPTQHAPLSASRTISDGARSFTGSVGAASTASSAARNGPPPPLPPKRKSVAQSPASSKGGSVSRDSTPERTSSSPQAAPQEPYAFPTVPPPVPAPTVVSSRSTTSSSGASEAAARGQVASLASLASSTASSLRGLPPPLPPKKKDRPSLAPAGDKSKTTPQDGTTAAPPLDTPAQAAGVLASQGGDTPQVPQATSPQSLEPGSSPNQLTGEEDDGLSEGEQEDDGVSEGGASGDEAQKLPEAHTHPVQEALSAAAAAPEEETAHPADGNTVAEVEGVYAQ